VDAEEAFGLVLRRMRLERKLSQEELAFESGLNRQFVSLLELSERSPSLQTVYKLAADLGVNGSDLLINLESHMRSAAKMRKRR
jgi:transcriptional regulator with XRE-family HTH domain